MKYFKGVTPAFQMILVGMYLQKSITLNSPGIFGLLSFKLADIATLSGVVSVFFYGLVGKHYMVHIFIFQT